jgi:hypothetical protein
MAAEYLAQRGVPRVVLLGIQPARVGLDTEPTPEILQAVETLADSLLAARAAP